MIRPDLRGTMGDATRAILEGLLRRRLYVVFLHPVRPLDDELATKINALLPLHWEWMLGNEENGRVFAAGPFVGRDGESYPGDGMVIYRADSLEEAEALANADPIVVAGLRTAEVRPWELNEGGFTITVRHSNGRHVFR